MSSVIVLAQVSKEDLAMTQQQEEILKKVTTSCHKNKKLQDGLNS